METYQPGRAYKTLKWIWLLSQSLTFPLAIQYYMHWNTVSAPSGPRAVLLLYAVLSMVCVAVGPVIWIIAESMLAMYRFPLTTWRAAGLVAGFYIQFAVLWVTGEGASFAMFVAVYTTFLASFACIFPVFARARKAFALGIVAIPVMLIMLVPPLALFPMLRQGFLGMDRAQFTWAIAVTALNTVWTVRELIDLTVFGTPDPREQDYYKEWERWAPPTVILLILSVVAGIVVAGIARSVVR